jgi:hypothetical protein
LSQGVYAFRVYFISSNETNYSKELQYA